MKELKMDLLTSKYTKVLQEEEFSYNAPHRFSVVKADSGEPLADIHFQEGPIQECGVNGVCNDDDQIRHHLDELQRNTGRL